MAQTRVEAPAPPEEPRPDAQCLPVGGVGAVGPRELGVGVLRGGVGHHIDARAEGSRAVGRGPRPALYLHVAHRRCEVGHVDPVDVVALGIVDGDSVGADVDARAVGAAYAHRGVAHGRAGVGGGGDRGGHLQEVGHVAPVVVSQELALPDIGEGHGGARRRAVGHDLHLVQHEVQGVTAVTDGGRRQVDGPRRRQEQEGRKNGSVHKNFFLYAGITRIRFGGYDLRPARGPAAPLATGHTRARTPLKICCDIRSVKPRAMAELIPAIGGFPLQK